MEPKQSSEEPRPSLANMPESERNKVLEGQKVLERKRAELAASTPKPFTPEVIRPTSYVKCPMCAGEWKALHESGVCVECARDVESKREAAQKYVLKMKEILGEKGWEEFTFEKFKVTPGTATAFQTFNSFSHEHHNLYIHGGVGIGKSHLAYALARKSLEQNLKTLVFKPPQLMRIFRGKEADEETKELKKMLDLDVLVVDDLGVGRATEFSLQILYEIIDMRTMNYKNGLVITSNLSLDDFTAKINDDRLPSRLAGMCKVIKVTGEDWRLRK